MLNFNKALPLVTVLAMLVVSSCGTSSAYITDIEQQPMPNYLYVEAVPQNNQGGIYSAASDVSLFEDMKASRVGDILTVLLVEQTSGQNSSDNNVNQSTAMSVAAPIFGGTTRADIGVTLGSDNAFTGDSASSQSNSLSGSIAVTVRQVLPNGNLVIQGEKSIRINQGNEFIRLQGVIRQKDIDAYNTLYSTQIADARIFYGGRGTNGATNKPGWASKILFSSLWPF